MRLIELEPEWLTYEVREEEYQKVKDGVSPLNYTKDDIITVKGPRTYLIRVERKDARGIMFLCPTCFNNNGGPKGTHSIVCWDPSVPLTENLAGPGRWHLQGDTFENLTLIGPTTSSVLLTGGCNAHFHIVNGEIRFC